MKRAANCVIPYLLKHFPGPSQTRVEWTLWTPEGHHSPVTWQLSQAAASRHHDDGHKPFLPAQGVSLLMSSVVIKPPGVSHLVYCLSSPEHLLAHQEADAQVQHGVLREQASLS